MTRARRADDCTRLAREAAEALLAIGDLDGWLLVRDILSQKGRRRP